VVAIAVVGAAGLAAANNGGEGQLEAAGAPAAAAAPAAGSDLPPNVREARAWIAAWKKKHNNP